MKRFGVAAVLVLAMCAGLVLAGAGGVCGAREGSEADSSADARPGAFHLAQAGQGGTGPSYKDVAIIMEKYRCTMCHSGPQAKGGLALDSHEGIMKGGRDGAVVVAGAPGKSELALRVKGAKEPRMPVGGPPWLSDVEVKSLENWIAAGAKGP
jgi:hypothetical protein